MLNSLFRKRWLKEAVFVSVGLILLPLSVHAAIVPCGTSDTHSCTFDDVLTILQNVYNFMIGIAALVALLFIVLAAAKLTIAYATSSVTENVESNINSAKDSLIRALVGLAVVACAYLIINTVIMVLTGKGMDDFLKPISG